MPVKSSKLPVYAALLVANLIYASVSIFTKLASGEAFLSLRYIIFIGCAVSVLALYALIWQQIIKRIPVSEAYTFKSTVIIFVLVISALLFGETVTLRNVIGALMIVSGIILYSKL